MPALRPIRLLIALFVLGTLLWKFAPMPSRTITFSQQNCSCKIPYNWKIKESSSFLVDAHRAGGGSFFIAANTAPASFNVQDPSFSKKLKDYLISNGHEIVFESREPFQGRPAYSYTMHKVTNGYSIYTHSIYFVAGNIRYCIETTKPNSDPTQDKQLQAAINSFTLINPASP